MRLRLLTWNIHKGIGMDRRFRPERIVEVIRHYQADVVLLQEVDNGARRSRRLDLAAWISERTGHEWHAWAGTHALKEGGYGNAILSRLPIRRRRNVDLTIGRCKQRAALYVRLDLPGHFKDLHVFNWHLGLSSAERALQVRRLLDSGTLHWLPASARVVVGGDTNDWRNLLFPTAGLQSEGFHAYSEHGRRGHWKTYPSPAPVGALDKFFWRGAFADPQVHASRLKLARVASDHLPLIGDFELVPRG
ncbi:MAG TPA: endonuclease/exonuclease/phosphatase family protein [Planctomycetota bacterium]